MIEPVPILVAAIVLGFILCRVISGLLRRRRERRLLQEAGARKP